MESFVQQERLPVGLRETEHGLVKPTSGPLTDIVVGVLIEQTHFVTHQLHEVFVLRTDVVRDFCVVVERPEVVVRTPYHCILRASPPSLR